MGRRCGAASADSRGPPVAAALARSRWRRPRRRDDEDGRCPGPVGRDLGVAFRAPSGRPSRGAVRGPSRPLPPPTRRRCWQTTSSTSWAPARAWTRSCSRRSSAPGTSALTPDGRSSGSGGRRRCAQHAVVPLVPGGRRPHRRLGPLRHRPGCLRRRAGDRAQAAAPPAALRPVGVPEEPGLGRVHPSQRGQLPAGRSVWSRRLTQQRWPEPAARACARCAVKPTAPHESDPDPGEHFRSTRRSTTHNR